MNKYKLGIDFGYTYTYIFVKCPDGKIFDGRDIPDLYDGTAGIPTCMITCEGQTLIGNAALEYKSENNELTGFIDSIKQELKEWPESDNNIEKGKLFFSQLFSTVFNYYNIKADEVESIVCGKPAPKPERREKDSTYENNLKDIFHSICKNAKARIIPEPTLAYLGAKNDGLIDSDGKVLVVDLGGGTNDFAIIDCQNDAVLKTEGGVGPGGNAFDSSIIGAIQKQQSGIEITTTKTIHQISKGKETVFTGGDSVVEVPDERGSIYARLFLNQPAIKNNSHNIYIGLSSALSEKFQEVAGSAKSFLEGYITENGTATLENLKILFVGGGSHIGPLKDMIVKCLNECLQANHLEPIQNDARIDLSQSRFGSDLNTSTAVAYGALFYNNKANSNTRQLVPAPLSNEDVDLILQRYVAKTNEKIDMVLSQLNTSLGKWMGEEGKLQKKAIDSTSNTINDYITKVQNGLSNLTDKAVSLENCARALEKLQKQDITVRLSNEVQDDIKKSVMGAVSEALDKADIQKIVNEISDTNKSDFKNIKSAIIQSTSADIQKIQEGLSNLTDKVVSLEKGASAPEDLPEQTKNNNASSFSDIVFLLMAIFNGVIATTGRLSGNANIGVFQAAMAFVVLSIISCIFFLAVKVANKFELHVNRGYTISYYVFNGIIAFIAFILSLCVACS